MRRLLTVMLTTVAVTLFTVAMSEQLLIGQDRPEKKKKDDGDRPPPGPKGFQLGKVLPPGIAKDLDLTPEQMKSLRTLEMEVKERLEKILTAEQRQKVQDFRPGPPPKEKDGDDKQKR